MKYEYYMIWTAPDGNGWSGPHSTIDGAKCSVPDGATAEMLTTPLVAMTPGEAALARPIRKGSAS